MLNSIAEAGRTTRHPRSDIAAWICLAVLAIALVVTIFVGRILYIGTYGAGLAKNLNVTCETSGSAACEYAAQYLGYGRWRVTFKNAARVVRLSFSSQEDAAPAGILLFRLPSQGSEGSTSSDLNVDWKDGHTTIAASASGTPSKRQLLSVGSQKLPFDVTIKPHAAEQNLGNFSIEEIGMFRSQADVSGGYLSSLMTGKSAGVLLCALITVLWLTTICSSVLPHFARFYIPVSVGLSLVLNCFGILLITRAGLSGGDLRSTLAAGPLMENPGSNLNYGLYMARYVLEGLGPMLAPGIPPWHRMPAYAYFVALAGRSPDLLNLAINTVFLQVLFMAGSLAVLTRALQQILPSPALVILCGFLAILPKYPAYTQLDTLMPGVAFLLLAATCQFLIDVRLSGQARTSKHILLHLSYALWFSFRPDIAPAWALISFYLYLPSIREWWKFLIPVTLSLAVALPWALFKQRYTGEFSPTTNSFGASLIVGQWQVPHPFIWDADDGSYFNWAKSVNRNAFLKATSDLAVHESLLFWFTFPGYVVSLVWHKFTLFWQGGFAAGELLFPIQKLITRFFPLAALTVVFMALVVKHRTMLVVLLGALVLFDAPVFFVVYDSGGRFYAPALASLCVVTTVLLLDGGFYRVIMSRPLRAGVVIALGLAIFKFGADLDRAMIASDAFRFSSPFVSSPTSSLIVWKPQSELAGQQATVQQAGGRHIDLQGVGGVGATMIVKANGGVRVSRDRSEASPLATLPISSEHLAMFPCRLHVTLDRAKGIVGAGVEDREGRPVLAAEPDTRLQRDTSAITFDFNVPISGQSMHRDEQYRMVLREISGGPADVVLKDVTLYNCRND